MELEIYVDASITDGISKYGYIIRQGAITLAQGLGFCHFGGSDRYDSAFAEYVAARLGYEVLRVLCRRLERVDKVTLFSDSQHLVEGVSPPRRIKVWRHCGRFTESYHIPIEYCWIASKKNPAHKLVEGKDEEESP